MASKDLKTALAKWRKEAKKVMEKAEEEGRELSDKEKEDLKRKKRAIKKKYRQLHRSKRLEKKKKKRRKKAESRRLVKKYKEDYKSRRTQIKEKWRRELSEAKEKAKAEGRSLTREEKKALKKRKKKLLSKAKKKYKSKRLSVKKDLKRDQIREKIEHRSRRLEAQKKKKRKKRERQYEYEKLKEKYLDKWRSEVARCRDRAEEEDRKLSSKERSRLARLKKEYLRDCKEEWKEQRRVKKRKEREKEEKKKRLKAEIRRKLDEPHPHQQYIIPAIATAVIALVALLFFTSSPPAKKVAEKSDSPPPSSKKKKPSSEKKKKKVGDKTTDKGLSSAEKVEGKLARVKMLIGKEHYREALEALALLKEKSPSSQLTSRIEEERKWIKTLAKEEWEEVAYAAREYASLGNLKGAKQILHRVIDKWKLAPYVKKAQKLKKILPSLVEKEEKKLPSLPTSLLAEIREKEKAFHFEKALQIWRKKGDPAKYRIPSSFQRYLTNRLQLQKQLLDRFISKVKSGEILHPQYDLSTGQKGQVVKADGEMIYVRFQKSQVGLIYSQIEGQTLLNLLRWKNFTPRDSFGYAILAYRLGKEDLAHRHWIRALEKKRELATEIFNYLTVLKKLDSPPEKFIVFRRRLVTPAEKKHLLEKEKIAARINQILARAERGKDFDLSKISEVPDHMKPFVRKLLGEKQKALLEKYQQRVGKFKKLKALKKELNRRRQEALKRIFDKEKYYKKKSGQVAGQDWVDEAVEKVRHLWENPLGALTKLSPELKRMAQRLHLLSQLIRKMGGKSQIDRELERILSQSTRRLSLKTIALNNREARLYRYNQKILSYNKKLASKVEEGEARQVQITNQYRIMMGLHALGLDTRLARAARKHSKEMKTLGYFDHNSPKAHRKTPSKRVKIEGYEKSMVGENIYMGFPSPLKAHKGWYTSPPHHRNLLDGDYEDIGVGAYSDHWTQNFGGKGKFKLP